MSIVFYPREYKKLDEKEYDVSIGVDEYGRKIVAYIPSGHQSQITGVNELSRKDYLARQLCVESPDNGKSNPSGIMIISGEVSDTPECRSVRVTSNQGGSTLCLIFILLSFVRKISYVFQKETVKISRRDTCFVYKTSVFKVCSRPASNRVLSPYDKDSDTYLIGCGRIKRHPVSGQKNDALANNDDDKSFSSQILDAYYYLPSKTKKIDEEGRSALIDVCLNMLDECGGIGGIPGLHIRPVNESNQVIPGHSFESNLKYKTKNERYESGIEFLGRLIGDHPIFEKKGWAVEIIPFVKFSSIPGNRVYILDEDQSQNESALDDKDALSKLAVKIVTHPGTQERLVSCVYSLSQNYGALSRMSNEGSFIKKISGEKILLAESIPLNDELNERPIEITGPSTSLDRAMWIINEQDAPFIQPSEFHFLSTEVQDAANVIDIQEYDENRELDNEEEHAGKANSSSEKYLLPQDEEDRPDHATQEPEIAEANGEIEAHETSDEGAAPESTTMAESEAEQVRPYNEGSVSPHFLDDDDNKEPHTAPPSPVEHKSDGSPHKEDAPPGTAKEPILRGISAFISKK